jgi:hypothetical protein
MKFLYPEFLYGLSALAIPVIIHLFNFRKAKKVYFSSTLFLRNIQEATSRKRRLKHYLILASRLLFIFFLVLAFAQPYMPAGDTSPTAENVLIYLDNSQSMTNKASDFASGLDQGMAHISEILKLYPANTNYKLLTNDFAPSSNAYKTRDELEDMLTEIEASHTSRSLPEVLDRLNAGMEAGEGDKSDLYIISDFQKSTVGDMADYAIDTGLQVLVVPVQHEYSKNVFLDTLYLSNPFALPGQRSEVHIVLRNAGLEPEADLDVRLFVNEIQSGNTSVSISANDTAHIQFALNLDQDDVKRCRISFEDFPVTYDNDFYFVINPLEKVNILEIKSYEGPGAIGQVYANESLFNLLSQQVSNVDYSALRAMDMVVLNQLPQIEASLLITLTAFADAGGTVLVIPGEDPATDSYQSLLGQGLTSAQDTMMETLAPIDFSNPFFDEIFEKNSDRISMPKARNSLRWDSDQQTILSLQNGLRYLSKLGGPARGPVYLFGSPLSDDYTTLHRHAIFVPVMYKVATGSKTKSGRLYYNIDEPTLTVQMDSLSRKDVFRLQQAEQEIIPAQRVSGNSLVMEIPKFTLTPGLYSLRLNEQERGTLAFNVAKPESILAQYTEDGIAGLFAEDNVAIFDASNAENFASSVNAKRFGVPLWKYAVILALFFLLVEILLIRFL